MKRIVFSFAPFICLILLAILKTPGKSSFSSYHHSQSGSQTIAGVDRSPMDFALSADGRIALTANAGSDSVSLADVNVGRVIAEVKVGKRPFAVALSKDEKLAVVSNQFSGSISILSVTANSLHLEDTILVGDEPRGVAVSNDQKLAYVAVSGEDKVVVIDLKLRKVMKRVEVGEEPWHLGLSPDGKRIAVGGAKSQDISILNSATLSEEYVVKLRGHNVRHIAFSPDSQWAYVPNIAERGRPVTKENIDQGWIVGNRLSRVSLTEEGPREAISLDPQGKAVGDVDGVATSPDGKILAVTAAGTHELLIYHLPLPFVAYGGPGDHIDPDLLKDASRFKRIPVGGRPLGVRFLPDGKSLIVANYLSNSLQVVDIESGQIAKTIPLGSAEMPSLARKGEAIFQDATRSFHEWFSCNTCHTEGNTNGANFDTFNDGSFGTPKKTLSLRGVVKTGPWTWHGHQKSLRQLVHDSSIKSMQGEEPTEADLDALMAYLQTVDFKPKAKVETTAGLKRGEAIFNAKGCNTCHSAPYYTTPAVYKVGLESSDDPFVGYNPPSLIGVGARSPYLHTGEARTLEKVLTEFHRPSLLTGKPDCDAAELKDLVEFLNSL